MSKGEVIIESTLFKPLFGNVKCGQFFEYKDELCIRVGSNDPPEWEAFMLIKKKKFHIPHTDRVKMVDCNIEYSFCALTEDEK